MLHDPLSAFGMQINCLLYPQVEQPQPLPDEEVKSQQPALAEEPKPAAWQESPTRMPLFMTPDLKGISSIISPIMSPEMSPIVHSTSATRIVRT